MLEIFKSDFPKFYQALKLGKGRPVEHILPSATEAEIVEIEARLNLPLPNSYKKFLKCARGIWLLGGNIQLSKDHPFLHRYPSLEDLTHQQVQVVKMKGGIWPPPSEGMLCFAEFFMEADGDQVLFDVSNGLVDGEYPVMYYAHEGRPPSVRKITDSFLEWIVEVL